MGSHDQCSRAFCLDRIEMLQAGKLDVSGQVAAVELEQAGQFEEDTGQMDEGVPADGLPLSFGQLGSKRHPQIVPGDLPVPGIEPEPQGTKQLCKLPSEKSGHQVNSILLL